MSLQHLNSISLRAWTNEKFLATKHHVWSCLIKFEAHQTFDQKLKLFLLFLCLMGDVFVCLDSRISNKFDAGLRTTLAQRLKLIA